MIKWGIRTRVLLVALLPAAAIAFVLAAYFTHTEIADVESALNERGKALAHQLALSAEYGVITANTDVLNRLARAILRERDVASVTITAASGKTLVRVRNNNYAHTPTLERQTFQAPITQRDLSTGNVDPLVEERAPALGQHTIGWVTLTVSHIGTAARQQQVLLRGLLISALGLIFSALLALRMSREVTKPIYRLNAAVSKIKDGYLNVRVKADSGGELGDLEHGINGMALALQESQKFLRERVDAATSDLRNALQSMELQNADLNAARDQALEASRVKSEFMANMNHEIRTPMNGILGFTNLLLKSDLTDDQREHVDTIQQSASHLMVVINDILDFTRIASGDLQLDDVNFDLRHVLDDAIVNYASMAYDKNIELVLLFYSDVPRQLRGDPARIRQVVTNLIGNALKFTQRGSVTLRIMLEDEPGESVRLRVSVEDTGVGLSIRDQKRLFGAFTQTDTSATRKFGGIGLGLVICKKLVEYMDGEIGLESQLGKGSTFWFTFVCMRRPDTPARAPRNPLRSLSCLVYDAHELSRLSIAHRMQEWEMNTTVVAAPVDVIAALKSSPAVFDFIVMGIGKEQIEFDLFSQYLTDIQHRTPIPIIVLVNSVDPHGHAKLYAQGASLVIPKLIRSDDLYDRLCTTLVLNEHDQSRTPETVKPAESMLRFRNLKVLVVDDSSVNRKLVKKLYELCGATVIEAENGEMAVQRVAAEQYDLILMDIHMPVMSGVDAAERIRIMEQGGHRTPIIALTANALRGERDRLIRRGFDDCLIKPMREESLWAITFKWADPEKYVVQPKTREGTQDIKQSALLHASDATRATEAESTALLDQQQALRIAGGNTELARELFKMFIDEIPEMKIRLNAAYQAEDLGALEAEAHKIHGGALYCAVKHLKCSAELLEKAAIRRNLTDISLRLNAVNDDIAELLQHYQSTSRPDVRQQTSS